MFQKLVDGMRRAHAEAGTQQRVRRLRLPMSWAVQRRLRLRAGLCVGGALARRVVVGSVGRRGACVVVTVKCVLYFVCERRRCCGVRRAGFGGIVSSGVT